MTNTQKQSKEPTSPSITYVISQYPAISHTFILGEVNGITREGIQVNVASINAPDRPYEALTSEEQAAYKSTTFVKSTLTRHFFTQCYQAIKSFPRGLFTSLASALAAGIRYPRTLPHQIAYWLEAIVVANMATKNNSTQLHAHFSTQGCTVAMRAAEMAGIDFSLTVHGPDEFYQVNEQHLEQKFAKANFIVCISDFAKSQVMKYTQFSDWDKLHVNNLGVDAHLFHPAEKNNERMSLLCVGRLCNAKGQGVLIQAAKLLRERGIDFTLRFVGDGPDRKSLEAFTRDNQLNKHIQFLGKVNHDQVQLLQREADIFVIPSFAEGIPIVLMEAMASGTPCVTTHITGIPELFTHTQDGLLVRPGNAVMLADALALLINDEELRQSIATEALNTVKEKWCIHKSNQRLAQLFTRLLSQ